MSEPKVFSAVPPPTTDPESLHVSVAALKANTDLLTGQSGKGAYLALTRADLDAALSALSSSSDNPSTATTPGAVTPAGKKLVDLITLLTHDDSNLVKALDEITNVIPVQINNAVTTAQAEINILIANHQSQRVTADENLQFNINSLTATTNSNTASISNEILARTTADSALSASISTLNTNVNNNTAAITAEAAARSTQDTAIAGQISTLNTSVQANAASITNESVARSNADGALSGQLTTVSARADQASAFGKVALVATASGGGAVAAEFTAEVSANGTTFATAGLRLQALNDGTGRVLFDVNQFVVRTPGYTIAPFAVAGGVVYINSAMIQTATITTAMIQDLAVDTLKIKGQAVDTLQLKPQAAQVPTYAVASPGYGNGFNNAVSFSSCSFVAPPGELVNILITVVFEWTYGSSNPLPFWTVGLTVNTDGFNYLLYDQASGSYPDSGVVIQQLVQMTGIGSLQTIYTGINYQGNNLSYLAKVSTTIQAVKR